MKKDSTVVYKGKIYTMNVKQPVAEAIAISGGKISFVGSNKCVDDYISQGTEVIDLDGKTVYPGFIESHIHVPGNAYNVLFNLDISMAKSVAETTKLIEDFVKSHPNREAYFGRGFNASFFPAPEDGLGPKKERLDEICRSKPIIISDSGSLETGKYADLIIADQDIYNCDPMDICKTRVLLTMSRGKIVYKRT
ncbi:hypothetical protein MASR2M70_18500 [Bacillota bacterium]